MNTTNGSSYTDPQPVLTTTIYTNGSSVNNNDVLTYQYSPYASQYDARWERVDHEVERAYFVQTRKVCGVPIRFKAPQYSRRLNNDEIYKILRYVAQGTLKDSGLFNQFKGDYSFEGFDDAVMKESELLSDFNDFMVDFDIFSEDLIIGFLADELKRRTNAPIEMHKSRGRFEGFVFDHFRNEMCNTWILGVSQKYPWETSYSDMRMCEDEFYDIMKEFCTEFGFMLCNYNNNFDELYGNYYIIEGVNNVLDSDVSKEALKRREK